MRRVLFSVGWHWIQSYVLMESAGRAGLLQQVVEAAVEHGVPLSGENALQRYDH